MKNLLSAAILCTDLYEAIHPIQVALGITDGGVAAAVFSDLPEGDDSWPKLTTDERRRHLQDWLHAELAYAAEPPFGRRS